MFTQILGTLTLVLAVAMVVIALPRQIRKNEKEKKCGLDILMVILPLGVYTSRACYAVSIESWYILIPDALGVFFSIILLLQYFKFRGK